MVTTVFLAVTNDSTKTPVIHPLLNFDDHPRSLYVRKAMRTRCASTAAYSRHSSEQDESQFNV
jgi:hypothetical protein